MFCTSATLSNGIRVVHHQDDSPVVYCGLAIGTGTRDEDDNESGLAHFTEHMLFKGTEHRKSYHIINRLETVGGTLDAYTTKEETFLYSAIPTPYFGRAVELLGDLLFHSTFPSHEIEKEKEVVLDEIQSYNDNPSESIFDRFDELIFAGSPLGRNILGNEEELQWYTTYSFLRFVANHYDSQNIVFFSFGNISFKQALHLAEKYLNEQVLHGTHHRTPPPTYTPCHVEEQRDTFQTHCVIGNQAYGLHHPQRLGLFLLNNIVGGPSMNSLLNMSVRERNGLAYTIESEANSFSDAGSWTIYFGCDHKHSRRCIKLIEKELKLLCEKKIDDLRLSHYKRQLIGQMMIAQQNKENLVLSMARSYLHFNHFDTLPEVSRKIETVSAEQLLAIANELFAPEQLTYLLFT